MCVTALCFVCPGVSEMGSHDDTYLIVEDEPDMSVDVEDPGDVIGEVFTSLET